MPRYPFTPELLDALPEKLAELFRGLEIELLKEICSRLKIADQFNEVTVQDIRALRSHGIDLDEIKKSIQKATGISEKKLYKLLKEVVKDNEKYYNGLVDLAQVTAPQFLVNETDIEAIARQAFSEFRNITRSMGFLVNNGQTMLEPAQAYQWALDSAEFQVQSGAISYNQAIANAVRQLADSGLKTVDYESGHHDQVDVAVRRAVMTGVNQLNQKYREQSMEYLETDLLEVSAHTGARDKGEGFVNHKSWQGKVYRWKKYPKVSNGDYPDFEETCNPDDVQGIGGANCRHSYHPFIEDVMERTYTDEELANIDPPPFEYEGRTYTAYEATQKQREIERTIRKWKRRKEAYEAAGLEEDATAAGARIRRMEQKYKKFSKAAGLPEQKDRMNVQYPGQLTDIKKFAPLKEYQGEISVIDKFSGRQYVVELEPPTIDSITQHFKDNLAKKEDRKVLTKDVAQSIINNSRLVLFQTDKKTLKFLSDNGYVVLGMKKQLITAVPEKLRKKYRDYLGGK